MQITLLCQKVGRKTKQRQRTGFFKWPKGSNGSSDWRRIPPAPERPPQRVPTVPERPPQRVPENYQLDWYYELTDNMVNALRPGDLLQFRQRSWGARYCHWAIYIGPFKHNTKNGEVVVVERTVSHLHWKKMKKDEPKHYCPEGGYCIYSKYIPASLSELKHEVEKSEGWRVNNATITRYVKKDRLTIAIMALAAARHGSSPAAQEF